VSSAPTAATVMTRGRIAECFPAADESTLQSVEAAALTNRSREQQISAMTDRIALATTHLDPHALFTPSQWRMLVRYTTRLGCRCSVNKFGSCSGDSGGTARSTAVNAVQQQRKYASQNFLASCDAELTKAGESNHGTVTYD